MSLMTFTFDGKFLQQEVRFPIFLRFCTIGTKSVNQCERIMQVQEDGKSISFSREWYDTDPTSITYAVTNNQITNIEEMAAPYFVTTELHTVSHAGAFVSLGLNALKAIQNGGYPPGILFSESF
jgi:hypothetical protein